MTRVRKMVKIFYISDTHFGHRNVIRFDERPFEAVEEMDEALIENWNKAVGKGDIVYHLGDFCWGKTDEWERLLPRLNGSITLIKGNHDLKRMPQNAKRYFADIKDYKEIKDNGRRVILCHYPILAYKSSYDPNTYMLHGHVHSLTDESRKVRQWVQELRDSTHNNSANRGQIYNVGCMMPHMDYSPRTLDEIIERERNFSIYE